MTARLLALVLALALAVSCVGNRQTATQHPPAPEAGTPTPLPTSTSEPTVVPESAADEQDVQQTVRQFAEAIAHNDEVVLLLTLSPGAQQTAAADDLPAVFGWSDIPSAVELQQIELDGDLAVASGIARFGQRVEPLRLRLLRLDGTWKIDGVAR